MNDFDICKRIAEIEGNEHIVKVKSPDMGEFIAILDNYKQEEYNPLTDDALCFRLMVKYKISLLDELYSGLCGKWVAESSTGKYSYDESPNKTICLAIIEANKD